MTLTDMIAGLWAIRPEMLDEIKAIYATHLRGQKIDIEAIEARLGRPLAREDQRYALNDGGVGVLQISGVIAPKSNLFMEVSGGMSLQKASVQMESAAIDPNVKSLVIAADTPGGNVLGVPEFAALVYRIAQHKPVVVHSDGQLASAGYWFGAAANAVYISGPVVQVGSIGVVVTRNYNPSATMQEEHVTAGKYKRIAKANEPLSADSRAVVQTDVDYVYSLFVDDIARFRGVSSDAVLEHMADGRVFRGQQAIDAGLVDGVSTLDDLIEQMATSPEKFATRRKARVAASSRPAKSGAGAALDVQPPSATQGNSDMEIKDVTAQDLQKDNAPLYTALLALGAQGERDRVTAVRATLVAGHEKLVQEMVDDGKTTGAEAAGRMLAAVQAAHKGAADAYLGDGSKPAAGAAAPQDEKTTDRHAQLAKVKAWQNSDAGKGQSIEAGMKALGFSD